MAKLPNPWFTIDEASDMPPAVWSLPPVWAFGKSGVVAHLMSGRMPLDQQIAMEDDRQERANDDRARAWLAQLPAAN